jgi:2-polyprenyl-3-methyl-5-hydroxy-6-metoxy-1,4-benzoquinol methylase
VGNCCARGYRRVFGERQARRDARRYRRKGVDATARRIVAEVAARGVDGASVLEVGGGVGAIDVELLRAGARQASVVELSEAYDSEARALLAERGLEGRVERRHGDFVATEREIEPADVVVMHRVVCCYPDVDALVGAAARHARRLLAMSFPRETWWTKLGSRLVNLWSKTVWDFESFVHPHARIAAAARAEGLRPVHEETGRLWHVAVLERV